MSQQDYSQATGEYVADCLEHKGWEVRREGTAGGFSAQGVEGQMDVLAMDTEACTEKFTSSFPRPNISAEKWGKLYDYYVVELSPCLERAGYKDTQTPGSKDAWVDVHIRASQEMFESYNPYLSVPALGDEEMASLQKTCPQYPPGW